MPSAQQQNVFNFVTIICRSITISKAVYEKQQKRPSSTKLKVPSQLGYPRRKGCAFSSAPQMASAVDLEVA